MIFGSCWILSSRLADYHRVFPMSKRLLLCATLASLAFAQAPDGEWEIFADGSTGRATHFMGAGGVGIAVYIRKPAGSGPFAVIVNLHGGNPSAEATYGAGRAGGSPNAGYLAAGWTIYAIDFRPNAPLDPIEWADTIAA